MRRGCRLAHLLVKSSIDEAHLEVEDLSFKVSNEPLCNEALFTLRGTGGLDLFFTPLHHFFLV